MAAELEVFEDSTGLQSRQVYLTNVAGSAIVTASLLEASARTGGFALADSYVIELEHDGLVWRGTMTPATGMPVEFVLPGGGAVSTGSIIPGIHLEFGVLIPGTHYISQVDVGWHAGTLVAGATGTPYRMYARNVGDTGGVDARLLIRPDAVVRNSGESPFIQAVVEASLDLTTPVGVWGIAWVPDSTYEFEVTFNGEEVGTIAGTVDGPLVLLELPDGPTVVIELLQIAEGPGEVEISAGFQDFQLAPDESGAPGTFVGPELVLGAMDPEGSIPFWIRAQAAPGRTAAGNPYSAQLQARIVSA